MRPGRTHRCGNQRGNTRDDYVFSFGFLITPENAGSVPSRLPNTTPTPLAGALLERRQPTIDRSVETVFVEIIFGAEIRFQSQRLSSSYTPGEEGGGEGGGGRGVLNKKKKKNDFFRYARNLTPRHR